MANSPLNWPQVIWQIAPADPAPDDWVETVEKITGLPKPQWAAKLFWDRGLRSAEALRGFLRPADYRPASPFAFGDEMNQALQRLVVARDRSEKVAIWGDFDADGITSTAVLWDGLRQFFLESQLTYFIPNRLKESHGLSKTGLDQLAAQGVQLIVTCDTGSSNPAEVDYAQSLGIEVIVTDHHTLPPVRPAVVAIVNPRSLPSEHPLAHLSGVAVAYKLIEALYERLPNVPTRPLSELVDLVAIGLIADLVELKGDCRYLAQIGIEQLQQHLKCDHPVRPGVARLLELCRRAGDRPTDISFGIGPRINAVSRIYGEASFCVELLTSRDLQRCQALAEKAELANTRRKALQNDVFQQVTRQLEMRDLSTMGVIVLCDAQWPVGVLGLVAGQVAQAYGKPTILLTLDPPKADGMVLARGSARSVNQIDLYDLMQSQAQLLTGFGGHPFAAGLSLRFDDLPMFTAAINQQYLQKTGARVSQPTVKADLIVSVADLGAALFQSLKLLEPCGMGNPVPKLLIQNAWFENVWHQKLQDRTGSKVGYIKASFRLCDESVGGEGKAFRGNRSSRGFPGIWWGHYKEDLPPGRWDAIAELDYNSHPKSAQYEIRLIEIRPAVSSASASASTQWADRGSLAHDWMLDRRIPTPERAPLAESISESLIAENLQLPQSPQSPQEFQSPQPAELETTLILNECPTQWQELQLWRHQVNQTHQPLALAYALPAAIDPIDRWKTLLGLAKYISREQIAVTPEQVSEKLEVSANTLMLGLAALATVGFTVKASAIDIRLQYSPLPTPLPTPDDRVAKESALGRFLSAVQEENFRRQFFHKAPISTLQSTVNSEL
jgi:single-stranded-DNA-specific exonuclease